MHSLRLKIALAMAILVFVAAALVGAISYRSTTSRLVDEVDRSITEATGLLVRTNSEGRVRIPARGLLGVYSVRVLNARGGTVNSSFDGDVELTDRARAALGAERGFHQETVTVAGDRYRVHTVGGSSGGVQVARSLGEIDRVLDDLRQRTVLLVVIVSALAALAGWLLAGSVVAPLRRLTRAATEVEASGDLDVELPRQGSDEVGRLGAAFAAMLGALGRSRADQQRLVQDAGHELRTPLTSVRTNLAVLRRHPDMTTDMRDRIVGDLDGEVGELTDLVNELVAVASGDLADQPAQDVVLGDVAVAIAERISRRRSRAISVEVSATASVHVPLAGLERVITNLIENAVKFDQTGGAIRVEVVGATLTVLDNGPGIPDDELSSIFERFRRATSARTMPGSGLGLAIVRELVERHGGSVSARNRPHGGAEVGFSLPAVDVLPTERRHT